MVLRNHAERERLGRFWPQKAGPFWDRGPGKGQGGAAGPFLVGASGSKIDWYTWIFRQSPKSGRKAQLERGIRKN